MLSYNLKTFFLTLMLFLIIIFSGCQDKKNNTPTQLVDDKKIDLSDKAVYESNTDGPEKKTKNSTSHSEYATKNRYVGNELISLEANKTSMSILHSSDVSENKVLISKYSSIKLLERDLYPIKLLHNINTSSSEYHPSISPDGQMLYFTGMDRTGFFNNKIDFTKTRNAGGEDIFFSKNKNGIWQDSKAIPSLNTNGHEAINQVLLNGDLLLTGNYTENMGPANDNNGSNTCDLFLSVKNQNYQLIHFDEPINSIYGEFDGYISPDGSFIMFSSDRPNDMFKYHKKGWLWNESYWGNSNIYVSLKDGDSWAAPFLLKNGINTSEAERSPWMSYDGLTLFLSSNGYNKGKKDLDIYFFIRNNKNDWQHWDGPYEITNLNSPGDDWGYQEDSIGNGFFARSSKLGYTPTKKAKDGTGFIFETNFRSGYEVFGQQSGSFYKDEQTDIYFVNKNNIAITLPDILFDVDSYQLSASFKEMKNQIVDLLKVNNPKTVKIIGHTDNDGTIQHNIELSKNRAAAVKDFLQTMIPGLNIICDGKGSSQPIAPNINKEGKQKNRRVEVFFE